MAFFKQTRFQVRVNRVHSMGLRMGCILLAGLWSCMQRLPLSEQNLAYQYSQSHPVRVQFSGYQAGNWRDIFMEIHFRKMEGLENHLAIWEKYDLVYRITESYQNPRALFSDTLRPADRLAPSRNPLVLRFRIPDSAPEVCLFQLHVRERNSGEESVFEYPIGRDALQSAGLFRSQGKIPVFSSWISPQDTVWPRSFLPLDSTAFVEFYPFSQAVALPPMAAIPSSGHDFPTPYPVKVEWNAPAVFNQPGYYRMASPTGRFLYGFVVVDPYFPWVTRAKDLADPLVYISTREERRSVQEARDTKLAVDQFWLRINSQKDLTRKLISQYYENVEEANRLFTRHKPGWKTDRGMVMSVYGPPPVVYRNGETETWQYSKTMGLDNTVFYFSNRPTEKNPHVWELKRFNEYDRVWYSVVELWRKGVINR